MKLVIEIPEEQKKMVDAIMELPPQDGATRTCNNCRFCENIEYTPWTYIITCHKRECQDYNLWESATKEGE